MISGLANQSKFFSIEKLKDVPVYLNKKHQYKDKDFFNNEYYQSLIILGEIKAKTALFGFKFL